MRAILQRVKAAAVEVDGQTVSKIGPGLVALIGVCKEDTDEDIPKLVKKVLGAKLWNEGAKSRTPAGGGADKGSIVQAIQTLSDGSTSTVSSAEISEDPTPAGETGDKFTLYAQMSKGTKPDFHRAMSGPPAKDLYEKFLQQLREGYQASRVLDGRFGAMMDVSLVNYGPVTITLDTREK